MAIPQGEVSSTAGFTLAACAFSFLVALIIGYLHGKLEFAEHKHQIMLQDKIEAEHACKHLIKLISKDHLHGNPQNDGVGPKIYQNAATQVDGRPDRSIRSSSAEDLVDLESDHAIDGLHDAEPVPEPLDLQYRGIRTSHDEIGPDPYAEYMAEVSHSRLDIAAPSVEKSPVWPVGSSPLIALTPTEPQPTDAYPGIWTASSADVLNVNVVAGSYKLLSPDVLGITTAPVFHATPTPAPGRRFARSPAFGPSGIVGHQSAVYDYRRQVVISNLPEMVTLHQVMSRVRCGMIVSCILLNTMALGCFGMSVMVRFKNGRDAFNFAEFASNNALIFGGQQADVSLSPRMDRPYVSEYCDGHLPVNIASFRAGGFQTRCLEIHNLPVSCGRVEQDTGEHDAIERLLIIADNTCIVRYRSIWAASRAYAMITQFPGYAGCTVKFAEDPCMGPLDEAILIDNVGVNLDQ